jgi:hypothetical protein
MILADLIGLANVKIKRDTHSTPWLGELIWTTGARLAMPLSSRMSRTRLFNPPPAVLRPSRCGR